MKRHEQADSATATSLRPPRLRLLPITGPSIDPIEITTEGPATLGRSSAADIRLTDQSVSRKHARLTFHANQWIITDLGSRHGTTIGGVPLARDESAPLAPGDTLAVGPWIFRVQIGEDSRTTGFETTTDVKLRGQVQPIPEAELGSLAERRLNLFMDCAARIHNASNESELAGAALAAVVEGTGFTRAALVRPVASLDEVEVLGSRLPPTEKDRQISISRSLLSAASQGRIVRLTETPDLREAVSVIELGIQSAICAPVHVGNEIQAFLYLDARESSARVAPDAAAFCGAIARMCGLAMANLQRQTLHERQRRLEADLEAARAAQMRIMPPATGAVGPIRYAMRSEPGRVVAGDLFDIFAIDDQRVSFMLGDVTGKGMGAALVMAMAQSHLHATMREHRDLERALFSLNTYLAQHSGENEFVSMLVGLIDPVDCAVSFVDAGHGYAIHLANGEPKAFVAEGGLVAGVDPTYRYKAERLACGPGDRIVVFSDGVIEQPSPDAEQFGMARAIEALTGSADCRDDVARLFDAVLRFAESVSLADDITVASIELHCDQCA